MTTVFDKLYQLFGAADALNDALWHAAVDPAYMSIDQFAEHASKMCGVEITFETVDVETKHVYGHIERYDGGKRAKIYIVKNIPDRYKPAVGAKEVCQVVLDTAEDWSKDGLDTLERLVTPIVELDAPENIAFRSEQMAERLSWELLYPYELRLADLKNGLSHRDVAARVRLPLQIVELLLSPPYIEWCGKWWKVILDTKTAKTANVGAAE